jgi:hypothetical protein
MHPEFPTIAKALDTIDEALRTLHEQKADINYLSMNDLVACVKRTRESFKVVTMSRGITRMIDHEVTNGKLD